MRRLPIAISILVLLAAPPASAQISGLAFLMDGSGDYVETNQSFGQPSALTITAWVKILAGHPVGTLIGNHLSGSTWESVELSDGSFVVNSSNSSGTRQTLAFPRIDDGHWHHLAAVWNGTDLRVYLDGAPYAGPVAATSPPWNSPNKIWFGARHSASAPPSDNGMAGCIDEIQIWNVARTQSQIAALRTQVLGSAYTATADSGLVGYWRFESAFNLGFATPGTNDVRDATVNQWIGDAVGGVLATTSPVSVAPQPEPGALALTAFPNPSRSRSEFVLDPVGETVVDVSVFDAFGRRVRGLLGAPAVVPGKLRTTWDGNDEAGQRVRPGLYFVRMRTNAGRSVTTRVARVD